VSSNIPRARAIITFVLDTYPNLPKKARNQLANALRDMHREPYAQRMAPIRQPITEKMRRRIFKLQGKHTLHSIANIVGLRNSGRVSDVLHGKR